MPAKAITKQAGEEVNIIRVFWNDTVSDCTWTCIDEIAGMPVARCTTVGWLAQETQEAYIITSTITSKDLCMGYVVVPKGLATKVEYL